MKTYNRALDFLALAMEQQQEGNIKTAAALFVKAATSKDASAAMAIIEASNAQAYSAKVKAQAAVREADKQKTAASVAKRKALAALIGENDEIKVLASEEPQGEPEKVEDEAIGEENAEDAETFANALASLKQK
jgi:hypothetical protein